MRFAAVFLAAVAAFAASASSATQGVSEADMRAILAAVCQPGKIGKQSCDKLRGYPDGRDDCGIELTGDGGEGRLLAGDTVYLVADYSNCEPHANSWGGSVLFERKGGGLDFRGYFPGVRLSGCVAMTAGARDRLVCTSGSMFQGYESDMVHEVVLAKDGAGKPELSTQELVSAGRSEDAVGVNAVECGKPIYFLSISGVIAGPSPETIAFTAEYADAAMIKAACEKRGRNAKLGSSPPQDNEAYLPKKAKKKKGRFVYDVAKGELLPNDAAAR
jgi:hypothetical protein